MSLKRYTIIKKFDTYEKGASIYLQDGEVQKWIDMGVIEGKKTEKTKTKQKTKVEETEIAGEKSKNDNNLKK